MILAPRSALLFLLAAAVLPAGPARAQRQLSAGGGDPQDAILKSVRLEQRLNEQIPSDVAFRDETGRQVTLADYLGTKPVMLVMIQYRCTMLCTEQMQVLMTSLKELKFTPGREFNLLIVSIDSREGPELATEMKAAYLEKYGRPEAAAGWHLLTGTKEEIQRLADAVGFHFVYDARSDQFAHPDGVMLLTPQGKMSRYFFSLNYHPRDLRLGLVEAARNKIGNPVDLIALLCFHYNPVTGRYGLAILSVVRLLAAFTVVALVVGIVAMKRREALSRRRRGGGALPAGA